MQEHAGELVVMLAGLVSLLFGSVIWFVKRDRKTIDHEIEGVTQQTLANGMKLDHLEERLQSVERNSLDKFQGIHVAIADLKGTIQAGFAVLRQERAEKCVSREELHHELDKRFNKQ